MKIINESKQEKLPIDFITSFIGKGWEEIGNLKSSIDGIKSTFKGTKDVEEILQDLSDAYLLAIGQMQAILEKKDYISAPEVNENLNEDLDEEPIIANAPEKVEKINDGEKVEVHTELPDYDVEVEQKGKKVEVEVEPKNDDEWPEPDISDLDDIIAAKQMVSSGAMTLGEPMQKYAPIEIPDEDVEVPDRFTMRHAVEQKPQVNLDDAFGFDFEEPEISEQDRLEFEAAKKQM